MDANHDLEAARMVQAREFGNDWEYPEGDRKRRLYVPHEVETGIRADERRASEERTNWLCAQLDALSDRATASEERERVLREAASAVVKVVTAQSVNGGKPEHATRPCPLAPLDGLCGCSQRPTCDAVVALRALLIPENAASSEGEDA